SADRNPNVRGALVTGLISSLPTQKLSLLANDIDAGRVRTSLSIGENLLDAGLTSAQLAKVCVVCLGTHRNGTSDAANVVIPTIAVFEHSGTLVNQQFRSQRRARAAPGRTGIADDLQTLPKLLSPVGGAGVDPDSNALWKTLAPEVPALAGLSYATLPAPGH